MQAALFFIVQYVGIYAAFPNADRTRRVRRSLIVSLFLDFEQGNPEDRTKAAVVARTIYREHPMNSPVA
jgi:hypothetical protein